MFIECSLTNSKKLFHAIFSSVYIMLIYMFANEDIEKPDEICLLTFVVDEYSGLFLHPTVFHIIHERSA